MRRLIRVFTAGVITTALSASIAACGGTVSNPSGNSGNEAPQGGGITIETARGNVNLPKPASKVVSLEWAYTEELVALGHKPVGNADNEGYGTWVTAKGAKLPDGVTDVGTRQEPSLEKIRALKPDLIVTHNNRSGANFDQLKSIAPVLSFDMTEKPQLDTMKDDFRSLGKAVGKEDKAREVLGELDAKIADMRERTQQAGRTGLPYAFAQGFTSNGVPSIRMFTDDSLVVQVLNSAGLRNRWTGKPDSWGLTSVGVEGFTKLPPNTTLLHVAAANDDIFAGALASNPVWTDLEFVKQGRHHALDPGTWTYGGPLSAMQLLDETSKALNL